MAEFRVSGRAIDWILSPVAFGAFVLLALRGCGRGPAPPSLVGNLLSGAFLLVALRNALTGGSPMIIGFCLVAAPAAHLADLTARWDDGAPKLFPRDRGSPMRTTLSLRVSKGHAPPAPKNESPDA